MIYIITSILRVSCKCLLRDLQLDRFRLDELAPQVFNYNFLIPIETSYWTTLKLFLRAISITVLLIISIK